jgi:hypothetical protein
MRSVRSVVRSLIAVFLALSCVVLSCVVLAAATAQASVQKIQQPSSRTDRADSHSLAVSITGITPRQYATAKTSTVTVSGTLSNHTGSTIRDIQVQLQWYPLTFATRSGMDSFTSGGPAVLQGAGVTSLQPVGTPYQLSRALANGATARWTVSFNLPQSFLPYGYYPALGDYPLQVEASSASSSYQGTSRTFLPYWPGKSAGTPLKVAWIWPLIDTPQQGACPQTLATNSLAGALAANGRLSTLLEAGLTWASRDDLTWAIDPALLSDATVMTHAHFISGGNAECTDRTPEAASTAAKTWLSKLTGTAGQPAFLTPYANVDAAALSHAGLEADLTSAYRLGDAVASAILPNTFGSSADGTGSGTALAAAWPTGGTADAGVLTSLARSGGVNTVVLNSGEMPTSTPPFDNALARTKTSTGSSMSVLLADSGITSILGSASAGSSAGAQFAAEQDFLAQTAMILAEGPNSARALVVAPPTGWDPSPAEAADVLSLTRNAPWLRATDLGALATAAAKMPVKRLPKRQVSRGELAVGYVDQLRTLDASLSVFKDLLSDPPKSYLTSLIAAVAVTQSSAWRGRGSIGGWLALGELSSYVSDLEHKVMLIPVKKILLAGESGDTLVSVQNGLSHQKIPYLPAPGLAIAVRVGASAEPGSSFQVTSPAAAQVVNPGMTQSVRLRIHSTSIGTTTLRLQLLTKNGSPLTWPHASESLSVEVTRFGRLILVIIFGALGALVLATVLRLRRKRRRVDVGDDDNAGDVGSRTDSRAHAGGTG